MNRRSFLSMMGFVAPVAIVKPTYFFSPPGGWGVKIHTTIGAWADYPGPLTATGADLLRLYYNPVFLANLKAETPSVRTYQKLPPVKAGNSLMKMEML